MQVLLVIFNNARDAFLEKMSSHRIINCYLTIDHEYGIIEILDNAGGIPADLLPSKIFESNVSTKGDKGTGIGLSICKMILEGKMNGSISAHNILAGASFKLKIPIVDSIDTI